MAVPKKTVLQSNLQPSERKRPKPLPKAGVWGWVEFANAAKGRRVCRPKPITQIKRHDAD